MWSPGLQAVLRPALRSARAGQVRVAVAFSTALSVALLSGIVVAAPSRGGSPPGSGQGSGMNGMPGAAGSMMSPTMMGTVAPRAPFDLRFIDQMSMHHQGAIVSARNMVANSTRPELRRLAAAIIANQTRQLRTMQVWRHRWYANAPSALGMASAPSVTRMMGAGGMAPMMGGSLQAVMGGDAADVMFLRMMIPHHQLAIAMSRQALAQARHPALKRLARTIIAEQSAQIRQMRGYLGRITSQPMAQPAPMMGSGMMAP